MLSQIRSYFPQTQNFLMDYRTLMQFKSLWGQEQAHQRCITTLPYLNPIEQILYQELCNNTYANSLRLEQERIYHQWVKDYLAFTFKESTEETKE